MKLKYKIISTDLQTLSVVVNHYSDTIPEEQGIKLNVTLPVPVPTGADLHKFIVDRAPINHFKRMEILQAQQANPVAIVAPTDEQSEDINDPTAAEIARAERNAKLSQSDWTQVSDAPVDKAAWATYRQALRDITTQIGFPENIIWPTSP